MSTTRQKHKLVTYPHPALEAVCEPVSVDDPDLVGEIEDMLDVCRAHRGAGLAMNQIGVTKRVATILDGRDYLVMLNPRIVSTSEQKSTWEEGCLSIPRKSLLVERYRWVNVVYWNQEGEVVKRKFTHLASRAAQHEIDHLNGLTILDICARSEYAKRDMIRKELGGRTG